VRMIYHKRGQVWVETVLYTLIGLALIGVVLAIILPKIDDTKDRISVEQTIESLNILDEKILDVLDKGVGNVRVIPAFSIKRGELFFDAPNNSIVFIINDLRSPYSEPGATIEIGRVKIVSQKGQKYSSVRLTLNYGDFANLTYSGSEIVRKFSPSGTPYRFSFQNLGDKNEDDLFVVDIEETSRRA
jgi:type II secretory pathway pseudopilin PulG